ncbi:hypothetical protein CDD82_1746 [Ophiocordyceps australis]|uniref:EH domain-containing protein n=1 Tax=Ophiocordyceps australis TaxID=1399860 RepID=A0A2C5XAJ0_9HYPO|nr:hypothetical protein CDD82_1746 [Ophiocordyceps australis]
MAASRSASPSPKASSLTSCEAMSVVGVDAASIASTGTLVSLFERRGHGGAARRGEAAQVSPTRSEGVSGQEARRMATERYMAAPPRIVAQTQPPTPSLPAVFDGESVSAAPSATAASKTNPPSRRPRRHEPPRRPLPSPPLPRASSPTNNENAPTPRLNKKPSSTSHMASSFETAPVPILASVPLPRLDPVAKPPPKLQPSKQNLQAKPLKPHPSIPHPLESHRLVKPRLPRAPAASIRHSALSPLPLSQGLATSTSDDKLQASTLPRARHAPKLKMTLSPSRSSLDHDGRRPRAILDGESNGQPPRRSLDSHVPTHSLALALGRKSSISVSPSPSPTRRLAFRRPATLSTGDLQLDSLTNAIMAGSLASARLTPHNTGSSLPPPPTLPRRQKSPRLLSTLRRGSASDKEESRKSKRAHRHKLHANHAHHEGSRRRWRDEMTERERKRYEAVWASNRGSLVSRGNKHHGDGLDQDDDDDAAVAMVLGPGRERSQCVVNVVVRELWKRSRLPDDELAEVWDLVDRDKRGMLTRQDFVVGMWLIDQRLRGRKLPLRVSESVWASSNGVTAKKQKYK